MTVMKKLKSLRENPILFAEQICGMKPTAQQKEVMKAVARPGAMVSIASGHGTGKSATFAILALWFVSTRTECRVPVTAPSQHQLFDIIWAEIRKWHNRMVVEWRDNIVVTKTHVSLVGRESESFAVARTSRRENPEALQGFHAREMLFLVDEASGVPDEVFQVAEGALSTPGSRLVMAGNPTRTSGYFYHSHHKNKGQFTTLVHSSEKSPLVSPEYLERMQRRYGADSVVYKVRVKGEFPEASADQFLSLGLLEESYELDIKPGRPVVWGLDPARFGDSYTALAKRAGSVITSVQSISKTDTMQTVGWLVRQWQATPDHEKPEVIYIDASGMGVGIADRLRELGYPAVAVMFSERPSSMLEYGNLRTELWSMMKDRLEARLLKMPKDERLESEALLARYTFDSRGRIVLESKREAHNRGNPSPDHMDAVSLTFYNEPIMSVMSFDRTSVYNVEAELETDDPYMILH